MESLENNKEEKFASQAFGKWHHTSRRALALQAFKLVL